MKGTRHGHRLHTRERRTSQSPRRVLLWSVVLAAVVAGSGCGRPARPELEARTRDEAALLREAAAGTSAEPYYQLALLQYARRDADGAVGSLQQALARDADYEPALTLLALLFHETGRSFEGAEYFARRELTAWPASVQLNVALLQADIGNTAEARRILETLRGGPWGAEARINLAYVDLLDEENAVARRNLEAVVGANAHQDPEVLNNLAVARLRDGDVTGCIRLLQQVTREHPEFGTAQLNLALVLRHYLFDASGAQRAEAYLDELVTPQLSDTILDKLLDPGRVEDAAPAAPTPTKVSGEGQAP